MNNEQVKFDSIGMMFDSKPERQAIGWLPIKEHPRTSDEIGAKILLTGPTLGTHIGTVWHYEDGEIIVMVAHISSSVFSTATHYMPLPDPPIEGER